MNIYMPGGNCLEATRRIRESVPAARVVILTVSAEDQNLFEAIKSGAHRYLLKKIELAELFGMLRGVSDGGAPISRATAAKMLEGFARQAREGLPAPAEHRLSHKEREVIELVAKGMTNKAEVVQAHRKDLCGYSP